jgi:hypothetical protein
MEQELRPEELKAYALIGIEAKIAELTALRDSFKGNGKPMAANMALMAQAQEASTPAPRGRRRKMSPASRKLISDMMKKRWAAVRAGKK